VFQHQQGFFYAQNLGFLKVCQVPFVTFHYSAMLHYMFQLIKRTFFPMYTYPVETNEIFSLNLTRLRKAKGFSQRELGKLTGISFRMINHYENIPTSVPLNKIRILADTLNVTIADFFQEESSSQILDGLDVRLVKKIKDIQALSESDRKEINQHISSLLEKSKLKEKEKTTK
jgi:transcriptional regulator with XRE-family HTH domain